MDLELVAVPGLGALTAGLSTSAWADEQATDRLARRDGQALGREANRALDAQVLVLRAVDEVGADWRSAQRREADAPFSRFLTFLLVSVMRILWLLAAGAPS